MNILHKSTDPTALTRLQQMLESRPALTLRSVTSSLAALSSSQTSCRAWRRSASWSDAPTVESLKR